MLHFWFFYLFFQIKVKKVKIIFVLLEVYSVIIKKGANNSNRKHEISEAPFDLMWWRMFLNEEVKEKNSEKRGRESETKKEVFWEKKRCRKSLIKTAAKLDAVDCCINWRDSFWWLLKKEGENSVFFLSALTWFGWIVFSPRKTTNKREKWLTCDSYYFCTFFFDSRENIWWKRMRCKKKKKKKKKWAKQTRQTSISGNEQRKPT